LRVGSLISPVRMGPLPYPHVWPVNRTRLPLPHLPREPAHMSSTENRTPSVIRLGPLPARTRIRRGRSLDPIALRDQGGSQTPLRTNYQCTTLHDSPHIGALK